MEIRTRFDYGKIPYGKDFTVRMMIEMEEQARDTGVRKPLNIGLVLDRSGSMGGMKLHNVKEAAKHFIGQLADEDIVSLTVFDDEILTIAGPTPAGRIPFLNEKIDSIEHRGRTFLSGGYEQGCAYVAERMGSQCISRVILLTDGLANVGVQNPGALAEMASFMRIRGITTTTIGVGSDYDEMLLGNMSEKGGGNAYFIEKPTDAVEVFAEEVGYLTSLSATECTVKLEPAKHQLAYDQLNSYAVLDDGTWLVGDLYSGQKRSLLLEMKLPAIKTSGSVELGRIIVTYRDAVEHETTPKTIHHPIEIEVVTKAAFKSVKPDTTVLSESSILMMAKAKAEAITLGDHRRFDEAAALLERVAATVEKLGLADSRVRMFVEELRNLALRFRTQRDEYYTAHNRKRMYHDSNMIRMNRVESYESMITRRNRST
ncbi:MAG TPA: VWA domain-containing protein [Deltaproteobacteria bacterium]|nr:VWA domain-containing protein [Deltaproteobacteria bacterium]